MMSQLSAVVLCQSSLAMLTNMPTLSSLPFMNQLMICRPEYDADMRLVQFWVAMHTRPLVLILLILPGSISSFKRKLCVAQQQT